ncbi:polysaccharide biosynthesis/export family protein [Sulfitobacter pacificus]|uniref:polysaccharide biosynthesis/export family protein n=1 Tax=Sulfitobacter pacificus TaxID=1499314 RepID=UPI0036D9C695
MGFLLVLALSSCALVYTSPRVIEQDTGLAVREILLDMQAVRTANAFAYHPPELPAEFSRTSSGSASGTQTAIPLPPLTEPQRSAEPFTSLPPPHDPKPYRIGVGDRISVRGAAITPTLTGQPGGAPAEFSVQSDGTIDMPGVGQIRIAGSTISEANAALRQALTNNRIDPDFGIQIEQFNSQRVSVGGSVTQPQVITLELAPLMLREALLVAGGPTEQAANGVVRIYRNSTLYQVPLDQLNEGAAAQTMLINGDSVFVDPGFDLKAAQDFFAQQIQVSQLRASARATAQNELQLAVDIARARNEETRSNLERRISLGDDPRASVIVTGEVVTPRVVSMPFGRQISLAEILFGEGGISIETGDYGHIYVLRGQAGSNALDVYRLNARNAANLFLASEFQMRPKDIVFVAEQPITRWNRALTQSLPSVLASAASSGIN